MYQRFLAERVSESLSVFRVTVVNGPRQSGKTTLLRSFVANSGSYASLDDDRSLAYALTDPTDFVANGQAPFAIDEVQRGGDPLVLAVKSAVDTANRKGMFLLAGSTRFLTVPQLSESLAGRAEVLDLWPLSQGELAGARETFLDTAFESPTRFGESQLIGSTRAELLARVAAGGFPEVVDEPSKVRQRWFRSYLRTVIERDIVEASAIRQADEMPRLVRLLAANSSGELVPSRLAGHLRLGDDVVRRYLGLLELVGLLVRIPAWLPSLTSREKRHDKTVLVDTGLALAVLGISDDALATPGSPMAGALLEAFVIMELRKQLSWSDTGIELRHWRDRTGPEVDVILESPDGRIVAVEVKATSSVTAADVRHIAALRDRLGDRFISGVVLCTATRAARFGDRIWTLPVSSLWSNE
jgi:uncharacterized protein